MSATESTKASAPAAVKSEQPELAAASAAEGRRLYIGNLAYATTEAELRTFFKDFLVEAVSIPTNPRTNRPVGYAFVDLSTPTEAERAIAELNSQVILERKVSIQLARKPEQQAEGAPAAAVAPAGEEAEGTGENKRRGSNRGRGRGRGRGGRAARGGRSDADANGAKAADGAAVADAPAAAATTEAPTNGTSEAIKTEEEDKERVARKQRGPPEDGIASKTKVMVANLPYDLREDKLMEIFKEYSPVSAKIALRPIPRFMVKKLQARGEARKGRGFGFVTLASEELQQKACDEMNAKVIDGREIAVKVAIDSPGKEDDPNNVKAAAEEAAVLTRENVAPTSEPVTATT